MNTHHTGTPSAEDDKKLDRKLRTQTFTALESEIEIWKAKAKADRRPLSQWIRLRLLDADARDEQNAGKFPNSIVGPNDEKA